MINIRKLLFPSIISGRRIISERFLGIQIGQTFLKGTVSKHSGSSKIIEKLIEVDFEGKTVLDFDGSVDEAKLTQGLEKVIKQAKSVDRIVVSLPANMFVFKEMEMPFCQDEKIKMVLSYEAEPLLPFSADSCAIDFLKAPQAKAGPCKILVCATEKNLLSGVAGCLKKAKIAPDNIVVDIVALQNLCQQVENRPTEDSNYSVISIAENWTKVGLVDRGLLRFVKNIPIGTDNIIDQVSRSAGIDREQAKELVQAEVNSAYGELDTEKHVEKPVNELCKKIKFALQSFSSKTENPSTFDKVIIFEEKTAIPKLYELCQQKLNVPCQRLSIEKMVSQSVIKNKASYRPSSLYWNIFSSASSLISQELENFDLGRNIVSKKESTLLKQQSLASLVILATMALYIMTAGSLRTSHLSDFISNLEKGISKKVSTNLVQPGAKLPKRANTKRLMDEAGKHMESLKNSWQLHGSDDVRPLEVLLDLTRLMDRNKFDLDISELRMFYDKDAHRSITIKGNFKKEQGSLGFKKLVSQLSGWKKFSDLRIKEEQAPDMIKFSMEANLEL